MCPPILVSIICTLCSCRGSLHQWFSQNVICTAVIVTSSDWSIARMQASDWSVIVTSSECTNVWCLVSQLYFWGAERLLLLPPICWQMTGSILCNNFLGLISTAPKGILICLHNSEVMTNQRPASRLWTNQSLGMHYGIITLHKATLHHICTLGTC